MGVRPGEVVIDDGNYADQIYPVVDGEQKSHGLIPRDYNTHPVGMYACAPPMEALNFPLIPRSEWSARIKEMEETKSRLSDLRRRSGPNGGAIPSLDQDGWGYCWNHSTTMAIILSRAKMGQPYVRLSAFMIGCLVKNYQDDGGWGALSMDFVAKNGVPDVKFWPEKSASRSNDTPEMRANAKQHIVPGQWADLQAAEYDRNMTFDQVMTLLLNRVPVVGDFNWWSHSVCLMDPVEVEAGSFGPRIINSWTDSYGDMGEAVLQGSKAIPDGAVAPLTTLATDL